jgi:hypothetical protein
MNWFRKHAMALGGTAVAVSLLTLTVPHAAHALVAALVQVTNTVAAPAIVSNMDVPGRIPYQSQVAIDANACNSADCSSTFPAVPANHRLVVLHLAADFAFGSAPGQVNLEYVGTGFSGGLSSAPAALKNAFFNQFLVQFELPVQFYVDAGQSFLVKTQTSSGLGVSGTVTATGYMLDCAAATCSAIAH